MSNIPNLYEIYKYFKANLYPIIAIAEHSETGEQLVIYQALYGDFKIYARELSMFISPVDKEKYPDVGQDYRFELQGADVRQREPIQIKLVDNTLPEPELAESQGLQGKNAEEDEIEPALDPMLLEFLDADTYEQRLNILTGLHHRITDEMITTMAVACDVEVEEGSLEERYNALKTCLLTLDKYECNRLRQ